MTTTPPFPRFDGLMHLAKREGVDIRPTLLRVLTDLYVQGLRHTAGEERQYVELASRLIDEVDDATRASIRARLAIYPETPAELAAKLNLAAPSIAPAEVEREQPEPEIAEAVTRERPARAPAIVAMQPHDASAIEEMFQKASAQERILILRNLETSPLMPAPRADARRTARSIAVLEEAALASDQAAFAVELASALLLPAAVAERIVADATGEPLACAAKALGMSAPVFQRIIMFLRPEFGRDTLSVFRLSRLYDNLSERAALIMLAVWRGAMVARFRGKYRPALYDDERRRARPAANAMPQPGSAKSEPAPRKVSGES